MNEQDKEILRQMKADIDKLKWLVTNIRGDGVTNSPNGIIISQTPQQKVSNLSASPTTTGFWARISAISDYDTARYKFYKQKMHGPGINLDDEGAEKDNLFEVNENQKVSVGTYVWVESGLFSDGQQYYFFCYPTYGYGEYRGMVLSQVVDGEGGTGWEFVQFIPYVP